jgi:hypothetical protein
MNELPIDPRMWDLISQNDFDLLTGAEQALIGNTIGEAEFKRLRKIHLEAGRFFSEDSLPEIHAKELPAASLAEPEPLTLAFRLRKNLNRKIPAWQAGLGMAAVLAIFLLLRGVSTPKQATERAFMLRDSAYYALMLPDDGISLKEDSSWRRFVVESE